MKKRIFTLLAIALVLTGCFPARIVTVSPYNGYHSSYATTVTAPRSTGTTSTRSCSSGSTPTRAASSSSSPSSTRRR